MIPFRVWIAAVLLVGVMGCKKSPPPHPLIGTWESATSADSGSVGLPGNLSFSFDQNTQMALEFDRGGTGSFLLHSQGSIHDTVTLTAQIKWRTEGGNPPTRLVFDKSGQIRGREEWNIELLNSTTLVTSDPSTRMRFVFRRTAGP